jgi:DNA-binding protein HU-beta
MNKNELIAQVAEQAGMSKADAGRAVDATFDVIASSLKSGDEVKIIGFGNFSVAKRAASQGRNPRTGESIKIAASKTPKFKAGKGLKDSVNG